MPKTPSVALLEAAWVRVYTSGSLISPKAVTTLKMTPTLMEMMINELTIRFSIENHTSLNELRKCHCPDKSQDAQQQDDRQEKLSFQDKRQ